MASNQSETVRYTTPLAALFITLNVTAGIGLLAMPSAMQTAGLVTSVINQVIILFMVITTCIMCAELTLKSNAQNFDQIAKDRCHPSLGPWVQASILLQVFGLAVAYMVIIGDLTDRVFASIYGPSFCYNWYMNRRFIMTAATVFVILPLCSAKSIDFLKYGSLAGIATLGFVAYLVIYHFLEHKGIAQDVNYFPRRPIDYIYAFPVYCLAYSCQLSFVPVAANMDKTKKFQCYLSVSIAMILTTTIYVTISVLAVLTFGSKIQSDLIESFSGNGAATLLTTAMLAFKCVVTLPPDFFPFRACVIDILNEHCKPFTNLGDFTKRVSVTSVVLAIALALALFVPDILVAADLIGFLCVLFIFTLPALCYLDLLTNQDDLRKSRIMYKIKRIYCYFLIIFGTFMMALILYNSISKLSSSKEVEPLCHL